MWVIAETTDLPTRYSKEVVTDDRGRYLIPELPAATYSVWARGYGLVDSPKVQTKPGKQVNLTPTVAPDKKTAARYYPANYWYAMLTIPEKSEFPGTGPTGNGISPSIKSQEQWLHLIKTDSCESCHQLGNEYTRTIPPLFQNFDSPAQAWMRRVQSGHAGRAMVGVWRNSAQNGQRLNSVIGRRALLMANYPLKHRRGHKALNGTWSSHSGIGLTRRRICMTKSRATSAIRA